MRNGRVQRMRKISRAETGNVQLELDEEGHRIVKRFAMDVILSTATILVLLVAVAIAIKKFF